MPALRPGRQGTMRLAAGRGFAGGEPSIMPIVRAFFALVVAAAMTVPATSRPAEARATRDDVVLRGTTTFSFTAPGTIRFSLPKKVKIGKEFDFDVDGSGRVYGFSFWKAGGIQGWVPGAEYVQVGMCKTKACPAKDGDGFAFVFGDHLPAGQYQMYVVADGAPVDVTFTVDGLRGRATYRPASIDAELKTLNPTVDLSHGAQTYSAGAFTQLPESDWSFFGMWALDRNDVATAYGSCAYADDTTIPSPPEHVAFLPGCPLSDSFEFVNEGPNGGTMLTVSDHGGPEGTGGWFTAGTSHSRYGSVAFWLDF